MGRQTVEGSWMDHDRSVYCLFCSLMVGIRGLKLTWIRRMNDFVEPFTNTTFEFHYIDILSYSFLNSFHTSSNSWYPAKLQTQRPGQIPRHQESHIRLPCKILKRTDTELAVLPESLRQYVHGLTGYNMNTFQRDRCRFGETMNENNRPRLNEESHLVKGIVEVVEHDGVLSV